MHLHAPHIEEAGNEALLKSHLLNRTQLQVRRRAAEKPSLEDQTVVSYRDLCRPNWDHDHQKENAADYARARGDQGQILVIKYAGSNQRQREDKPSESAQNPRQTRPIMDNFIGAEALFDITHLKGLWLGQNILSKHTSGPTGNLTG